MSKGVGDPRAPWVLFHGFTGRGASWDRVIEALRVEVGTDVEVWAPDLPGHGENASVRPELLESFFEATAAWLGEAIESRFGRPVRLAGYSLGGRLALGLAVERPELCAGLVLIGCHAGMDDDEEREDRAARDEALADDLLKHGLEAFVDRWQALPLFASQGRLPAAVREEQRRRRLEQDPEGLAWALRALSPGLMPDYGPRLGELPMPVRLVAGALDAKYRKSMQGMAEAVGSGPTIVEDCGHNPLLEAPEALAKILAQPFDAGENHG